MWRFAISGSRKRSRSDDGYRKGITSEIRTAFFSKARTEIRDSRVEKRGIFSVARFLISTLDSRLSNLESRILFFPVDIDNVTALPRSSNILSKPEPCELPAGLGREEISIRRPEMRPRRNTGAPSQHNLIAHKLPVIFPKGTRRGSESRIG